MPQEFRAAAVPQATGTHVPGVVVAEHSRRKLGRALQAKPPFSMNSDVHNESALCCIVKVVVVQGEQIGAILDGCQPLTPKA